MKVNKLCFAILFVALAASGVAWAGGDAAAGEAKAASCAGCHGANGEGNEANPAIAGLDAEAHFKMLQEYKAGTRGEAMMQMLCAPLTEEDMADIAAYYATLGAE
jgi:cytochrome c553